ncbi:hypothetical protein [Caballeronia cordobensis]|uniref:hypothetical protein n=1 Tax=Caballeronia cordobensis TaxID=1353886 RepID=UPI001F3B959F|nr:hypothetical protein [Caballeronia cordobensis]
MPMVADSCASGDARIRDGAHSDGESGLAIRTTFCAPHHRRHSAIGYERMMTMQSKGFDRTARQLIVGLPLFMGAIEYILRVALKQPGRDDFFPISLVASSVSLNMALTLLPNQFRSGFSRWATGRRITRGAYREYGNLRLSDWLASVAILARRFV